MANGKVAILTKQGKKVFFEVEICERPEEYSKGLMERTSMEDTKGMLFQYQQKPRKLNMWMKNCYFPLDMIFVGTDNRICHIAENTKPESEHLIPSKCIVNAVIEINGGLSKKNGININDQVFIVK